MNQPSTAATPAAEAPASGVVALPSLEERISGVNETLDAAYSESVGEAGGASPPAEEPTSSPAVSGDADQRAADRRARLEALKARTEESVARKAQQAQAANMARELEALRARAEQAERDAAGRIDVSNLDEAALFALAEQKQISPQRLGEWIRNAMTNPEKLAEAAALQATKATFDPKLAALEAKLAEQSARIEAYEARLAKAHAEAEERQQTQAFVQMVASSADRAPLAARLLEVDQDEFMEMASIAAQRVPGMGAEALLDAVEELLDGETRKVAQKFAALYGIAPSQPTAPTTPTNRGAAKPTTVSNSLAQERASLVEDEDFARLPIEERAARIVRSMR